MIDPNNPPRPWAMVIQPTGDIFIKVGEPESSYEFIKEHVSGYFECVTLSGGDVTMWVNEEGKIYGLPENVYATWAMSHYGIRHTSDWIAGPAVFTGGADSEGETLPLDWKFIVEVVHALMRPVRGDL